MGKATPLMGVRGRAGAGIAAAAASAILCAAPGRGLADAAPPPGLLTDTVELSAGVFVVGTDTQVRIDGEATRTGSTVDLGRDLGSGDQGRFQGHLGWGYGGAQFFLTGAF